MLHPNIGGMHYLNGSMLNIYSSVIRPNRATPVQDSHRASNCTESKMDAAHPERRRDGRNRGMPCAWHDCRQSGWARNDAMLTNVPGTWTPGALRPDWVALS